MGGLGPGPPSEDDTFTDVFSVDEIAAMATLHDVWDDVANRVPDDPYGITVAQRLPEWDALRRAALAGLAVFQCRGRLPEDEEVVT